MTKAVDNSLEDMTMSKWSNLFYKAWFANVNNVRVLACKISVRYIVSPNEKTYIRKTDFRDYLAMNQHTFKAASLCTDVFAILRPR